MVAICAMILPGISGAFILVLLGKYHYVLEAVNNRDFFTLAIVALGAVCGLVLFSRLLNWLFSRQHDPTIALLCGLMVGSLRKIWPFKTVDQVGLNVFIEKNIFPTSLNNEVFQALVLALLGVFLVLFLDRWAEKTGNTANSQA
jgi:putative membrane protein